MTGTDFPRVLWVADKLGYGDRLHGLGAYYRQVLPALPPGRVVPAVLRSTDGIARQLGEVGVELVRLDRGKLDPRTLTALLSLIRREQVQVLHLHGYGASTFGRVAARWTGRPAVIHQHDEVMHAPWYGRVCDRLLAGATHRAIGVSGGVARYCTDARYIPPERVELLYNSVAPPVPHDETTIETWRAERGLTPSHRLVGSLTRLREEKGVRFLIEAWPAVVRRQPDARLVLFGDGEQRGELETLSRERNVADSILFEGFRSDATRFLAWLEVFVLPSLHEGLPFALMEALAAGRPTVATAVGGMGELLTDERDALTVPAAAPGPLAEALLRLLDDGALAARLSTGAIETSERFSLRRHVESLTRLYREAAA